MRRVAAQIKAMRDGQQESVKVIEARNLLKSNPDDAGANAAVGRYVCFFKGDWAAGLPLLAKGPSGPLTDLARLEIAGSGDSRRPFEVGRRLVRSKPRRSRLGSRSLASLSTCPALVRVLCRRPFRPGAIEGREADRADRADG